MKYDLVFHSDVQADYNDAYSWYENQKKGLGEEFLLSVRKKLEQILENPEAFSVKYRKDYREASVDKFPYNIVYKIHKRKKEVFVNTIYHQRRNPKTKYRKRE